MISSTSKNKNFNEKSKNFNTEDAFLLHSFLFLLKRANTEMNPTGPATSRTSIVIIVRWKLGPGAITMRR